ncbi:alpha/beta hydrolase family protein [Aspergillus puulaauensis]|uniref:AB hydrolase-1 domain-containing protein n=1 Tax=Aspergillus puulaauensis TaxID=1220207 RepID=A0A7R7Y1A3_9EURO|nr:uncharacterized protein APUU_80891S [Aspergillus puulaauensis]BCS30588.1 hypothetical protein APUU_80891S [Aspergillus puulaauensis]
MQILFVSSFSAIRLNDKNIIAGELERHYDCGRECQENLEQGVQQDRNLFRQYPFDYDFYATADNFTAQSRLGDVLKLEEYPSSGLDIPPSLTAYKMQYVTVGLHGEKVPATAFIALPFTSTTVESGKLKPRLVAFAHGTIGVATGCAPTSSYNFYDYYTWEILSVAGYAVVATDYTGLGNNYTSHKYVNAVLNGEDVYWSVIAARRAFPNMFTRKWAAVGHSQGGAAVWGLSENERVADNQDESGEYIGSVALAPAPRVYDLAASNTDPAQFTPQSAMAKYVPLLAKAVQSVNPPGTEVDFLTDAAARRGQLIDELQLCLHGSGSVDADLPLGGIKNISALSNSSQLKSFQANYGAALGKKGVRDLFVLQGTADQTVNYNVTKKSYESACAVGNIVHLFLYPGLDHRPVLSASAPEWVPWLDAKFRGAPDWQWCEMQYQTPLAEI